MCVGLNNDGTAELSGVNLPSDRAAAADNWVDRLARAADYLGITHGFDGFRARVMELRAELAIPQNLTALGVERDRLDELTEMALEDPSCGGNPIEMTRENTRALFGACM